jgi:predicted transglutaminase-like cysteine proteinase
MNMIATLKTTLTFFFCVVAAEQAFAGTQRMQIEAQASPPVGYVQFCKAHSADCGPLKRPEQIVKLTDAAWRQLNEINTGVNTTILPATDMQVYGVLERWEYPRLAGDCEDFVLEKRRELLNAGWPDGSLLITVVRDEVGDGHAVLTVRTDRGDVVLDNKNDRVLVWSDTPYTFLKRQSTEVANAWDLIEDSRTSLVGSLR